MVTAMPIFGCCSGWPAAHAALPLPAFCAFAAALRACTERPQCSAGWLLRCETFNSSFSIARWSVWILFPEELGHL